MSHHKDKLKWRIVAQVTEFLTQWDVIVEVTEDGVQVRFHHEDDAIDDVGPLSVGGTAKGP